MRDHQHGNVQLPSDGKELMVNPKQIAAAWIVTDVVWAIVFAVALRRHLRRRDAATA